LGVGDNDGSDNGLAVVGLKVGGVGNALGVAVSGLTVGGKDGLKDGFSTGDTLGK
jgi:hypothetical protein